jgi:hypothetical protein
LKNRLLSVIENDLWLVLFGKCFLRDLVRGLDELSQHRLATHDLRVVSNVGRVRQTVSQVGDETDSTDCFERVLFLELFTDQNRIDLSAAFEERDHRDKDATVRGNVEIFGTKLFNRLTDQAVVEQDSAKNSSLCFSTVWKRALERLVTNWVWSCHLQIMKGRFSLADIF